MIRVLLAEDHETVREGDGKVLARLATAWLPRQGASPLRP